MAELVVFVAGSDTEVGKTWVAARLLERLKARGPVCARKPVQSFAADDAATDAELLAAVTGEPVSVVCGRDRSYELPLAPPIAAEVLNRPSWTIADLASELAPGRGAMVVEGVGGPLSPLARDGNSVDFARALLPDVVVLVVPAALGAINAALSGTRCFSGFETVAFLNRFDDRDLTHRTNRSWLVEREGLEVTTTIEELATAVSRRRTNVAPDQPTVEVS